MRSEQNWENFGCLDWIRINSSIEGRGVRETTSVALRVKRNKNYWYWNWVLIFLFFSVKCKLF